MGFKENNNNNNNNPRLCFIFISPCYMLQYLGCHVLYVPENMSCVLCVHTIRYTSHVTFHVTSVCHVSRMSRMSRDCHVTVTTCAMRRLYYYKSPMSIIT